jgi:hypothetical protein
MKPPFLDTAIVKAMQRNPSATRICIRDEIGCTNDEMKAAIKRLRWAGKLHWARFELAPSLCVQRDTQGASGTARKAPGAASSVAASRGSASAPPVSPPDAQLPTASGKANGGAGIARRGKRAVPDRSTPDCALPGPSTIADQVKAEATAAGERRALATKISTGMTPLPAETLANRIRRISREAAQEELAEAADAEAEAQDRRERDLAEIKTISALLRKAQRDWPSQCAAVKNYAAKQHIGLGEAWARVIAAGCSTVGWKEGRV